ncbi:alpha-galactosidase [Paenibacillus xerothermodurans]|uniref:Alpha-galactosidase n=1 Tax=Paenibacillus xerothermodurans TaxID=1977292 RepID=A0A2W1NA55_PAEXE|nr:alpha-galactosidase [Paenibacillus xerothermodurans]PZE20560.1 alpha-galactosidase [Paenibacillus xerothermodurans]
MSIHYNENNRVFHLTAKDTSYVIHVLATGQLVHAYWGRRIRSFNPAGLPRFTERPFSPNFTAGDKQFSLDHLPQEYPAYGTGDFRHPAYEVQFADGTRIAGLVFESYRIVDGKPGLTGLPATYVEDALEAQTLEIVTRDTTTGLTVTLSYTAFTDHDAITRSVRFTNEGDHSVRLDRALSVSVDLPHADFDLLHLSGTWARERHAERVPLTGGTKSIESRRGASSHQHNPFVALMSTGADEEHGDVYGFNLVYSGNFAANIEVDPFQTTRVSLGINPFDLSWLLEPGESFQAPEAVLVYSAQGLGRMSRTYHKLYRSRLCRGRFRDKERPVLVNNWEATYFDFNEEKIVEIAKAGKELGIELFVLDDGWFGHRDDDKSSLGDWFVDTKKLPNGLDSLAQRVVDQGMEFGLWFEPEMVSPDSDLYREHPDWCLHVPDRDRTLGRNQLVLDLSRQDVCDETIRRVSAILSSAPITYVKWDMNRHMTEIGSAQLPTERQKETAHRYMLGLYNMMEKITSAFPHVLFESCSGGGGRFDPGILYYMPQTWTSDNTDAVARLKIQYGTSIVYPISAMGSHVSAVPNHQMHRTTSLQMRGDVAMSGNFGYELDLTRFTAEEKELAKQQVAAYKEARTLIQRGDFYRLASPFDGNITAWMFVSDDRTEALVAYFKVLAEPGEPLRSIRLRGLDTDSRYRVAGSGEIYGGDELMYKGLHVPVLEGDFQSLIWRLSLVQ